MIRCFEVCPLWFVVYYKTLDQIFKDIDKGFKSYYGQSLHLEYARMDWSPVHVAEAGIRIDRILIARVTNVHVGRCTKARAFSVWLQSYRACKHPSLMAMLCSPM